MPGFNSITGDEAIVYADNASFDGTARGGKMTTNGQLWIGSTIANHVKLGQITSPLGTLTIGYSSPNITIDLAGGGEGVDSIGVDTTTGSGTNPVVPTVAGLITFTGGQYPSGTFGTRVMDINSQSPNNLQVLTQISSAVASTDSTKNGLAHFNSTNFTVDANGFVSATGATAFHWITTTQATQPANFVVNTGYICLTGGTGNVSIPLPTTSAVGTVIAITQEGATSWTITQGSGQQIRFGNSQTTSGAGGSLASTGTGDALFLVCSVANTRWSVFDSIGNITVV